MKGSFWKRTSDMLPHVTPLISIIIPVHNAGVFLEDCLNSVIGQTLREIEIICVDDCSTDGSLAKLESYGQIDGRITVISKLVNEGPSAARNLGMETASGKYLLFVDADDVVDTKLCQKAYGRAEEENAGMVIYDHTTSGSPKAASKAQRESPLGGLDSSNKRVLLGLAAFPWSKMILTHRVRSLGIRFPVGLSYSEDALVHWRSVLGIDDVVLLPERLYYYRQHVSSVTRRWDLRLTDRIRVYDQIREFLLNRALYLDYCEPFLQQQLGVFYGVYDRIDQRLKRDVKAMIEQRMTDEHWRYVADGRLPTPVRDFFMSLNGDAGAKVRRSVWLAARGCYRLVARNAGHSS